MGELKTKHRAVKIVWNIVFYIIIALFLLVVYNFMHNDDAQKSIAGYRTYSILTPSMNSVYPVGSMVVVKVTPAEKLKVGDDITFYKPGDTERPVWTHRITEILSDYNGQGLAFKTKGVDNTQPDAFTTLGGNVVGTVSFCIPYVGYILTFAGGHPLLSLAFLVAAFFFVCCIVSLFRKTAVPRYGAPEK